MEKLKGVGRGDLERHLGERLRDLGLGFRD